MKLHVTLTSPYARTARAALIEHELQDDIEVVPAQTRKADSPYYRIATSGRVPVLELADGRTLEETDIIVAYFDHIGRGTPLTRPMELDNWQYAHLHGLARSYIDGIGVWGRELRRPKDEQSPTIIAHERARAERLADLWEREISHPLMNGDLNLAQLTLYCAFDSLIMYTGVGATPKHPKLQAWRAALDQRPSLQATKPPERA
jgi:glutathione S-transferase